LKEWKEGLAATNADEIKQLQRGKTLSASRTHRQMEWGNYQIRGLREREASNSLRIGRLMQPQDAINIITLIRSDEDVCNREYRNHGQCDSHTAHHGGN
jgi:hypothetical protein